jgi:hypothetical protein
MSSLLETRGSRHWRKQNVPQINNLVIVRERIAFFCIPKCANASVKQVFHETFGQLRYWSKERIRDLDGYLTMAIVRDPFERAISTWAHKILELGPEEDHFRYGKWFELGMTFLQFCETVAEIPDPDIDVHFQSQAHLIAMEGHTIPEYVYRFESLLNSWSNIQDLVLRHCYAPLPSLPHLNATEINRWPLRANLRCRELINRRYGADYQIWEAAS